MIDNDGYFRSHACDRATVASCCCCMRCQASGILSHTDVCSLAGKPSKRKSEPEDGAADEQEEEAADAEEEEEVEEEEEPPKKQRKKATPKKAAAGEKAAAKRTPKKKKDPDAPKRGLSAYMFFCNAKRAEVKEANPGARGSSACGICSWCPG
jgi:hypothetical protein